MDFDALVLRDGERVTATGLLVRNDQGDWLQPHLPMAAPVRKERRIESVSRGAVRITGADFAILANRFEQHGAVQGSATVTGVWSGDQLRIDQQTPPRSRAAWVHPSAAAVPGQRAGHAEPVGDPTNLLSNVVSTLGALYRYWRQGQIGGRLALVLIAGTLPGVIAGSFTAST